MNALLSNSVPGRCLRRARIIDVLTGLAFLRVVVALAAGSGPGFPLRTATVNWIVCAGSLLLTVLLDQDVRKRYPGIRSLCRRCSYVAIAGSSLPAAMASLALFTRCGAAPVLAGALAGLALTLSSAAVIGWVLSPVVLDRPLPSEQLLIEHMSALAGVLRRW